MELTVENVRETVKKCLPAKDELSAEQIAIAEKGEALEGYVRGDGVRGRFLFNKAKLEKEKDNIVLMLRQLPHQFMKDQGGGWSFVNACVTEKGDQWGEQRDIDDLVCLGVALGVVSFPLPREHWSMLPGGMPYFCVDLTGTTVGAQETA